MADFYDQDDQFLPLRETVYKKLRKRILTGELKPGDRLMEIHLANELDVSRTPIREAIRKLELEGLVRIIPRSGAQVARISEREMKDLLEVRRSLDMLSVELASERITSEEKVLLRRACRDFEEATKHGDYTRVAEADVRFHDIIVQAARNRRLQEIISQMADQTYRYRFEYVKDEGTYAQLVEEHRGICDAILSGDGELAKEISIAHIDRQEAGMLKRLQAGDRA